jgi:hypothetical protein
MTKRTAFAILPLGACMALALPIPASTQSPLQKLEQSVKEKAADDALSKFLNDQLPLNLNAKNIFTTVSVLPGGPFQPLPLQLTAVDLDKPLPPGDYTIPTLALCSEYSVHRPGAGVAYVLGPLEGKAAGAIGALYWRGTVQYHIPAPQLITVGWAIQSGLTYAQMPKTYQAMINQVIPDLKTEMNGDFVQSLESTYQTYAKTLSLPPLDQLLAKMGEPGQLALSAERQRAILLQQGKNDQLKDQTLFQGQESGVYTPVKAENGPWTVRIPGVAYMKLTIIGGHLQSNNYIQIRILPHSQSTAQANQGPRIVRASYESEQTGTEQTEQPTLADLIEGVIGYSQGRGAQALAQVPVLPAAPATPAPQMLIGKVAQIKGKVTVLRNGVPTPLNVNDPINANDILQTAADGKLLAQFNDGTQITLSPNASLKIDDYVFDPNAPAASKSHFSWLTGAIVYIGGLIGKKGGTEGVESPVGCIGIRGTEFVARYGTTGSFEVDLIEGSAAIAKPVTSATPSITAPAKITFNGKNTTMAPLTQAEYDAIKAQLLVQVPAK